MAIRLEILLEQSFAVHMPCTASENLPRESNSLSIRREWSCEWRKDEATSLVRVRI